MTSSAPSATRQIARAAGTVTLAFLLTQLIGLGRGIIIYRVFGTSTDLDSFNAANRVAELLFNLMAGGALGSAFIPTFTGLLTHEQKPLAWKLASSVANLLLVVLTLIAGLAAMFAPQIVRGGLFYLAPDLPPGQEALTILLLRTLLPTVIIFGLSGLVMGILNAHQRFWLPAIAPAMYSLGQIGGVLLLPPEWGIHRLAIGALVGALLHLLVQLPGLLRLHGKYSPTLGLYLAEVRQVAALMGPRILGVAVVQINFHCQHHPGAIAAGGQRFGGDIGFHLDADAPGGHRPVGSHRRHAHLFRPGGAGQAGRAARGAGGDTARCFAAGHSCHGGADPAAVPADPLPL